MEKPSTPRLIRLRLTVGIGGMWGKHTHNRLIASAQVKDNLSPIGDIQPANEAQACPLTKLEIPHMRPIQRFFRCPIFGTQPLVFSSLS